MQMDRIAFENSLLHPIDTWLGKRKEEIRRLLGDETARMAGYDQHNPHHCYSLLEHSLRTVDFLPENVLCLLRAAAFFHDIGKPASLKYQVISMSVLIMRIIVFPGNTYISGYLSRQL